MGRPNAGGGRHNQNKEDVPARARFSNLPQHQRGKGGKKGEKGKSEKGKGKDKGKDKGKGGNRSAVQTPVADNKPPAWTTFALTGDDRQAMVQHCTWDLSEDQPPIDELCWGFGEAKVDEACAYANPLEYLLGRATDESKVPPALREKPAITKLRRMIEDRNLRFAQTTYADVDTQDVIKLERMGFGKPRVMEALSGRTISEAARWLFVDTEEDLEDTRTLDERRGELEDEVLAIQAIYGDEVVDLEWSGSEPLQDLDVKVILPSKWIIRMTVPASLPYPMCPPLVSARHAQMDAFNFPLLKALRQKCREVLGTPALMTLCDFIEHEANSFLRGCEEDASRVEESQEQKRETQDDKERREQEKRIAYIKSLDSKEKEVLEVRDASENHTVDLAGFDAARVRVFLTEAFGAPRAAPLIRVTLILGGGKLVRQEYDANLAKIISQQLSELGYEEDTSAALSWESCGFYKMQHDLKRNLRVCHVFPKTEHTREETQDEILARLASAEMTSQWITEVRELSAEKKDALQAYIDNLLVQLAGIEGKFQAGHQATLEETKLYDRIDVSELEHKLLKLSRRMFVDKPEGPAGNNADAGAPEGVPLVLDEKRRRRRGEETRDAVNRSELAALFDKTPLRAVRETLPAFDYKERIQQAVHEAQVVIIQGDTGCGKSTQVPQFLLEGWARHKDVSTSSAQPHILMSQPRRISAIGVADRIAEEMHVDVGSYCGYQIRLDSKKSAHTMILVATTGVILRRLEGDRHLSGVTHIIVDECHERDLDTDFLLIILREMLKERPDLKVILMSATINADVFISYFSGSRSVLIPGRTFPVQHFFLEHALVHTNFNVRRDDEYSKQDYQPMHDGEYQELIGSYDKNPLEDFVPSWEILDRIHRMDPEKINFDLVAALVSYIHLSSKDRTGSILIFVPGLADIKKCGRALEKINGLWVLFLHSTVAVAEQRLVFKKAGGSMRKVVISTNIAETSITIDDITVVIDCGRHKQTKYDPSNRISMLVDCVETKANAKQRKGRAGRVQHGICYTLLNWRKWRRIEDYEKPEMLRVPLNQLCLHIQMLNLGHPFEVLRKAISPPTESAVQSSLSHLVEINALEELEKSSVRLTNLGRQLSQLPVDTAIGTFLLYAVSFGILEDALVIAASYSTRSPFTPRFDMKKRIEFLKVGGVFLESDFLMVLKLYTVWKEQKNRYRWCSDLGIDNSALETLDEMKKHLYSVLKERGLHPNPTPPSIAGTSGDEQTRRRYKLLRALITASLWPNCVLRRGVSMHAKHQAECFFHPQSALQVQQGLCEESESGDWRCKCDFYNFSYRYDCKACGAEKEIPRTSPTPAIRHEAFVYLEKVRTVSNKGGGGSRIFIKGVNGVSFKTLSLLASEFDMDLIAGRFTLGGWITLEASPRDMALLSNFRRQVMQTLDRVHSHSRLDCDVGIINACAQILVVDCD